MSVLTKGLAGALALCASAAVQADTLLYDNGAPNHVSGNNLGFAWQAEDFVLTASDNPGGIRFYSLELADAYRGSISWQIVGDNSGLPGGTIYAQGNTADVQRSATGVYFGLLEYENRFALSSPPSLPAGSYWLVLHNGAFSDMGDPNEFLWETAADNASHLGMETVDGGLNYTINFNQHAFAISAVPEPSRAWLLLAGCCVLGALRRRAV